MTKIVGSGTLVLAMAMGVCPARADTVHTTGGADCQSYYDPNSPNGQGIYYSNGSLSADTFSQYDRFFSCPMQRTNGQSTTGISSVYVDLWDGSHGGMFCVVNANDEWGNTIASSATEYSNGSEIVFGDISPSHPWGFYTLLCAMPPGGGNIYSYQWVER